jgi:hypothetical protein
MPVMSTNIKLHLYVGLLLLAGYAATIVYRLVAG